MKAHLYLCFLFYIALLVACSNNKNQGDQYLVDNALNKAQAASKKVILVFGADWCPPCRKLHSLLSDEQVATELSHSFEIVEIDVGHWDKNLQLSRKYGNPIEKGIPGIAILDESGKVNKILHYDDLDIPIQGGSDGFTLFLQGI
jgi:thioredoxin 1